MSNKYLEIEKEIRGDENGPFITAEQGLRIVEIERLDRIASALEDINSTLISMSAPIEQLSECVGYAPPRHYQKQGYNFLRIAGQVDTD